MHSRVIPEIRAAASLAALCCLGLAGCGGAVDANEAGQDTYLDPPSWNGATGLGNIAVDPLTETVFVVGAGELAAHASGQTLWAARADGSAAKPVANLGGQDDLRILFPKDGLLLMSEGDDHRDTLQLLDPETFVVRKSVSKPVRYHGTRLSPSGRWVAVADNTSDAAPIHVIDAQTLQHVVIPHDGDWLEAVWLSETDTLAAIVFYDPLGAHPAARILTWSLAGAATLPDAAHWPAPDVDLRVEDVRPPEILSIRDWGIHLYYTRIGVHPRDEEVVFPVTTIAGVGRLIRLATVPPAPSASHPTALRSWPTPSRAPAPTGTRPSWCSTEMTRAKPWSRSRTPLAPSTS
jgi:hypothetical protein